jgi:ribosomal protein S18 acetylase RimI-like enzyme
VLIWTASARSASQSTPSITGRGRVFAPAAPAHRDCAHWARFIASGHATTFIAVDTRSVLGYAVVDLVEESHSLLQPLRFGRIGSIGIAPSHQCLGLGRALMRAAKTSAQARGASEIRLEVWTFNVAAIALYAELGYALRSHNMAKSLTPAPEVTTQVHDYGIP